MKSFGRITCVLTMGLFISLPAVGQENNWTERIKLGGDLRLRTEFKDDEANSDEFWRNRFRARLKLIGQVNEDLNAKFRLVSGGGSATSTNQDFEDASQKKDLFFDWAYADWNPSNEVSVLGGKFPNPFYRPNKSQLIFDSDLSLEGVSASYASDHFYLTGGGFWQRQVTTTTSTNSNVLFSGLQIGGQHSMGGWKISGGLADYVYNGMENEAFLVGSKGNSEASLGSSTYGTDFNMATAFLEFGYTESRWPVFIYADYVQNTEADEAETGFLAGLKIGKAKKARQWHLSYDYRETEADAVIGGFNESDFAEARTDSKGHKVSARYMLGNQTSVSLTYIDAEYGVETDSPLDFQLGQFDLAFKF